MLRISRRITLCASTGAAGSGGGGQNSNNTNKSGSQDSESVNVQEQPQQGDSVTAAALPSSESGDLPQKSGAPSTTPAVPLQTSVDQTGVVKPYAGPRSRPYMEYSGESREGGVLGTDVTMGSKTRKDVGSVLRPSSVTQTPKPLWMSNTERRWVSCPVEFGKSTVDTRREWFRVMHYNTLVDKWEVPIRELVRGRTFVHQDSYDKARYARATPEEKQAIDEERRELMQRDEEAFKAARTLRPNFDAPPGGKLELGKPYYRGDDAPWQTTPIANVDCADEDAARWHKRGARIAEEIVHYDPDILTMNEVNRSHFQDSLWRLLRSQGYGSLFVSARSREARSRMHRSTCDNSAGDPVPYWGSIGNAIFFHKARFVPLFMPGTETPRNIPYLHFAGLRDRVMNLTVWLACVQLTAGDDVAAIKAREQEARGVFKAIEALLRDSDERLSSGLLLCGDLNNTYADEPCVTIFRDKLRDAHDALGGSRFTSWYKRNMTLPYGSQRHSESDYELRNKDSRVAENKETLQSVEKLMRERAVRNGATTTAFKVKNSTAALGETSSSPAAPEGKSTASAQQQQQHQREEEEEEQQEAAWQSDVDPASKTAIAVIERRQAEERIKRHLMHSTATASDQSANLAMSKIHREIILKTHDVPVPDTKEDFALKVRDKYGVVKTTSDFMLYEDRVFSVLRVLDVPPDSSVMPRLTFEEEQEIIEAVEAAYKSKLEHMRAARKEQRAAAAAAAAAQKKSSAASGGGAAAAEDDAPLLSPMEERSLLQQKKAAIDEAILVAKEFWRPGVELLPNQQFPSHHIPLVADVCWNRWSYSDWTDPSFASKK